MTKTQQDEVRSAATRMIYGPLSHENVLIKGAMFFLNKLDTKLGRELFDYDFFVQKFKNSYAFKYAPQLNDQKFLGMFNKYDAGLTQRGYVGVMTGIGGEGTEQELRYDFEEETGMPTFPVIQTVIGAPFKAISNLTTTHGLDKLINVIESNPDTKKKLMNLKQFDKKYEEEKNK